MDIHSKNYSVRSHAERIAFNSVIQGTAADIIKLAMKSIDRKIQEQSLAATMVMQIHDELVFYIREDMIKTTIPQIKKIMEKIEPFEDILRVNFTVSSHLT